MSNLNLLTNADANLILTGYIGPNQPRIGRVLADKIERRMVDFEARLEEQTQMRTEDIVSMYGEARLKTLEGELLSEVLLHRGAVIRIGGETLMHGDNLARLAKTGPVICLVASLDAVLRRMHLSMGARFHNPNERDLALGTLRRAWSARGRDGVHEVNTTYLNEEDTVAAIITLWQQLSLQRG